MNATHPLKILMPPGRRRDDSEKPQSPANLFAHSEKEKGTTLLYPLTTGTLSEMTESGSAFIVVPISAFISVHPRLNLDSCFRRNDNEEIAAMALAMT